MVPPCRRLRVPEDLRGAGGGRQVQPGAVLHAGVAVHGPRAAGQGEDHTQAAQGKNILYTVH